MLHVASLLWAIEVGVRMRESLSVTDKKAYWVMPPEFKKVQPAPISEIKWSNQPRKSVSEATSSHVIPPPTEEEQSRFLSLLAASPSTGPEEPVRLLRFWPDQYLKLQQYF